MEIEVIKWLGGVILVPLLAFCISVIWLLRDIKKASDQLLIMHQKPDDFGIGTAGLHACMDGMKNAVQDQTHYMKWMAQQMTGKKPPPPVSNL